MSSIGFDRRIDARALRTRQLLAQALIALGAARGVEELDVADIVQEAGVARSTFYAHFAGKDDFLVRSFVNMIAAAEAALHARCPDREDLIPSRALFMHVQEAGAFALSVAQSSIFSAQMEAGEAKLREIAEANLKRQRPDWTVERRRETAVYVAGGFVGLLRWWMRSGLTRSADDMQAAFERLTRKAMGD